MKFRRLSSQAGGGRFWRPIDLGPLPDPHKEKIYGEKGATARAMPVRKLTAQDVLFHLQDSGGKGKGVDIVAANQEGKQLSLQHFGVMLLYIVRKWRLPICRLSPILLS